MKKFSKIKIFFALFGVLIFSFVMTSCDGDCMDNGSGFKKSIEKAAPGTQPTEENTDEC